MSQVVALRPYTVGGVYAQFRNAASVRRNHGMGDLCTDVSCQQTGPAFTSSQLAQLGQTATMDTSGGDPMAILTFGVLALYMITAMGASR